MCSSTLKVIFALCFCITITSCAVMMEAPNPTAGRNKCLSATYNLNMNAGETVSIPGVCMEARCKKDGGIMYASCGVVMAPPGCQLIAVNSNLPYPDCCTMKHVCN